MSYVVDQLWRYRKAMRALYATDMNSMLLVTLVKNALWQACDAIASHISYCITQVLLARLLQVLRPSTTMMWQETEKAHRACLILCHSPASNPYNCQPPNLDHWRRLNKQYQTIIELSLEPLLKGKSCNGIRFTACFHDEPIDSESHYFFLLFKLSNAKGTAFLSRLVGS